MIKISIVIATYNAGEVLGRCLGSIVGQLNEDVELIIIDGGSKDKTLDVINNFRGSISYVVSEPDKGIYDAWNKGVKCSKGEWIMFIGADDILLPFAVQNYMNCILGTENNIKNIDYICAQNEYIDQNGKILKIMGADPIWSRMRRGMSAAHVASLHSKMNLFDQIGGFEINDFRICSDYELLLRKGKNLNTLFLEKRIARMQVGGMSFSVKAIIETYYIRKKHKSISTLLNCLLFVRDWVAFKLFIIRKKLIGAKL